jgi:hypothetical protein
MMKTDRNSASLKDLMLDRHSESPRARQKATWRAWLWDRNGVAEGFDVGLKAGINEGMPKGDKDGLAVG